MKEVVRKAVEGGVEEGPMWKVERWCVCVCFMAVEEVQIDGRRERSRQRLRREGMRGAGAL